MFERAARRRRWSRVPAQVALVGVSALGALSVVPGSSASAQSESGSAAVVTPLLMLMDFGDTLGMPEACNTGIAVLNVVAGQSGAAEQVSPLLNQLQGQCATLSQKGDGYLQQAIVASRSLAFVNPVADPVIAGLSSGLTSTGTTYSDALFPFGPTVAGLGGTVVFFEGS